jgi:threonine dehydrogenase-like Zn-dependent dehydrogenase
LGHENVGVVSALGASVANRWGVKEGDRMALIASGKYPFEKMCAHTFGLNTVREALLTMGREACSALPFMYTMVMNESEIVARL